MNLLGSYAEEGIFDLDPSSPASRELGFTGTLPFPAAVNPIGPDVKVLMPVCGTAERRQWWGKVKRWPSGGKGRGHTL